MDFSFTEEQTLPSKNRSSRVEVNMRQACADVRIDRFCAGAGVM